MTSTEALKWRYATKKFDPEKILSEEKIGRLKNAFNLTATSYGLQPLKLVIIRNKDMQLKLQERAYNQKQISTASHVLIICAEKNIGPDLIEDYFRNVSSIRNTPEDILRPYKENLLKNFEKAPEEEIRSWAHNQAYLVLGALLTVCAVEEIDSCPMEGFQADEFNEFLELGKYNLQSVLVLPVGFRAKDDIFAEFKKVRRPLQETILELPKK